MSNHRRYASPYNALPGPDTIIANIVKRMPDDAAATVTDICASVGHEPRSMRALISTAVERIFIRTVHPPHTKPQRYELTPMGKLAKQHYLALER